MEEMDVYLEECLLNSYSRIVFNEVNILKSLSDITIKEIRTLDIISRLEKNGKNNATNVASVLGITLGTLTTNIDRLIKKELVEKDKLLSDKRTIVLTVTQSGKKVLKSYKNEHLKVIRTALKNLTTKEKSVIVSLVNKFEI